MLTQATYLTAQTNTAYHKMVGAAKRWDISAAYCTHASNTSNSTNKHSLSQDGSSDRSRQKIGHLSSILCSHKQQHLTAQTNTAYHKMGHLIGAAERWDISTAYCAHTSNTSNSTNSLSQDGSSDRSRQEMRHLSSILCSHKQHIYQTQDGSSDTSRQKMGHLSSILCSHTQHRHSHKHHIQDVGAAKANRSLQRDVQLMCPILPLMGLGLQITTPFLHGMHKTLVLFGNHEHTALTLMPSMIHKNIREVKSITRSGMKPEYCVVSWGGGHSSQ